MKQVQSRVSPLLVIDMEAFHWTAAQFSASPVMSFNIPLPDLCKNTHNAPSPKIYST